MRKLIVSQEIIDKAIQIKKDSFKGDYLPSRSCPIALAGKEIGLVSSASVYLVLSDFSQMKKFYHFVNNFDGGRAVEPIDLILQD